MGDTNQTLTGLDKMGALLKQMGISEEATKQFLTVCEDWHKNEESKLKKEYDTRLSKAKKICVEEVEAHKANLSRGVQMFLESKLESISKAGEKQAAIAESEAVKQLKQVKNLLSGLDIDSAVNAQALQAEGKKNAKLTAELATLKESLARETAKSAKMAELAEKTVARQKSLEGELSQSKKLLGEAKDVLQKSREGKRETISEHKQKSAKPKTKQPISENKGASKPSGGTDIDAIAAAID